MSQVSIFPSLDAVPFPPQGRVARPRRDGVATRQQEDAGKEVLCSPPDLEDFFDNGALALHLVGADGIVLKANKAELEFLGYRARHLGYEVLRPPPKVFRLLSLLSFIAELPTVDQQS